MAWLGDFDDHRAFPARDGLATGVEVDVSFGTAPDASELEAEVELEVVVGAHGREASTRSGSAPRHEPSGFAEQLLDCARLGERQVYERDRPPELRCLLRLG